MQPQFYSLEFDSVQTVFHDSPLHTPISHILQPGRWTAIRGPSGSGKTTLLRAALGFCEDYRGTIRINNSPIDHHSIVQLRHISGYLPQRPYLGQGTVDNVMRELLPSPVEHQRLHDLFPRLGFGTRIWGSTAERLSGGELQRAAAAVLLARRPKLLCLDEPTSGLDDGSFEQLLVLLQESGAGGFFSSHDSRLLQRLADSVIELVPTDNAQQVSQEAAR